MNGIKYIREKSNFSKNSLAERIGVTRQTVTLWESGVRKPDAHHLQFLCEFFGIPEKWFGELSETELEILNKMLMYRHRDGEKEYYSFIPVSNEIGIECGEMDSMLDDKYACTVKKEKSLMLRVEEYLRYPCNDQSYLFDKIATSERAMAEISIYLSLMDTIHGIGAEGRFLKVPFRYEIKTVLFAMMVASGQYSVDEIKNTYSDDFEQNHTIGIDEGYFKELVDLMSAHWDCIKTREIEKRERFRKNNKTK